MKVKKREGLLSSSLKRRYAFHLLQKEKITTHFHFYTSTLGLIIYSIFTHNFFIKKKLTLLCSHHQLHVTSFLFFMSSTITHSYILHEVFLQYTNHYVNKLHSIEHHNKHHELLLLTFT